MKIKKIVSVFLTVCLCATLLTAFTSCGNDGKYKIGILQLAPHDALDAATNGFKQALIDEIGEENLTFDLQNAAGEANTCATIANTFVNKKYDLIMANATSALQAVANATLKIPVLGTSITSYGEAMNITDFNGTVGGNISGTSDLAPLDQQAQMVRDLFPSATKVGVLYCSAEPNSEFQYNTIRPYLEALNFTCSAYKFADSNDVSTVTGRAAAECDVLYIPTDNTAASCANTIWGAMTTKKPIFAGEEGICKGCGVATLSISYYDLGYATGKMAAKILRGEADISQMPIEYAATATKMYNPTICEELGIAVPEGYTAIAMN